MAVEPLNGRVIRVLIVDDVAEGRASLRQALEAAEDMRVVGEAQSAGEVLEQARSQRPDVVLLDAHLPDADGIETTERLTLDVPETAVILLDLDLDRDRMRRAMLAGARDVLEKPCQDGELLESIRTVHQRQVRVRLPDPDGHAPVPDGNGTGGEDRGWVVSVFSSKGGTGATTLATNLAVALAQRGRTRVVLVDGSLQGGDISVFLNLPDRVGIADLVEHMEQEGPQALEDVLPDVLVHHTSGVLALLAPQQMEMADLVRPDHFTALLGRLARDFDFVVVDTPSQVGELTLNLMDTSDQVLLLTTPEIPDIRAARRFLEVWRHLDYRPDKCELVINKLDPRSGIRREDIELSLRVKSVAMLGFDPELTRTAVNTGMPFVSGQPRASLSKSVTLLAGHVAERAGVKVQRTAKRGFGALLRRFKS